MEVFCLNFEFFLPARLIFDREKLKKWAYR